MIRIDPQTSDNKMPAVVVKKKTRQRDRMCKYCERYGKTACNADLTYIPNIADIADALNRNPRHLTNFICQKLLCNEASYDFVHRQAIFDNDTFFLSESKVQGAIYAFVNKFVLCTGCKSPKTIMAADFSFQCTACGREYSFRRPINASAWLTLDFFVH
jgi:translation initiation factor 2 beta subunit (eIF-2beta)/eIF-5